MLNNFASEVSSFSCVCCTTWANQEKEGAAMVGECWRVPVPSSRRGWGHQAETRSPNPLAGVSAAGTGPGAAAQGSACSSLSLLNLTVLRR